MPLFHSYFDSVDTTFAKSIPLRPSKSLAAKIASSLVMSDEDAIQQFIAPFSLKSVVISLVSTSDIPIISFSIKKSSNEAFDLQLLGLEQ